MMDDKKCLAISDCQTIASINNEHNIYLVQHSQTRKIYIKKILAVYNLHIYEYLQNHRITGIPALYDMSEENGQLTIIEEFISGTPLSEIMDSCALSIGSITRYICELCDILEQLHSVHPPIIHRDIKPSNIIITPYDHVVLLDFNAAKYMSSQSNSDTVLLGTKGYAAPEQYGFGASTPQTDIYALGILLKELSSACPAPTTIFSSIIDKCTQMNPADRMENVTQLKAEIQKLQSFYAEKPLKTSQDLRLTPPGFRTKTPWKMFTACVGYLFIFWLCLSVEATNVNTVQLWIQRIICLVIMLSIVGCSTNYCNVQRFVPLCTSPHRFIRYLGILLLNLEVTIALFVIMVILVSIF
jgi:hypothetical protein